MAWYPAKGLECFYRTVAGRLSLTIERFMALQAMGSPSARKDVKLLKQAVLSALSQIRTRCWWG